MKITKKDIEKIEKSKKADIKEYVKKDVKEENFCVPSVVVSRKGDMNKNAHKVYNSLLKVVEDYFYTQNNVYDQNKIYYFDTTLSKLSKETGIVHFKEIKKILLKDLFEISLQIEVLNKNNTLKLQLVGELRVNDDNEVSVFFSPTMLYIILKGHYITIQKQTANKFKSKYSLIFYEQLKRYDFLEKGIFLPKAFNEMNTFKKIMGISEIKTYNSIYDLQRRVLTPMVEEINNLTEYKIDIEVIGIGKNASLKIHSINKSYLKKNRREHIIKEKQKVKYLSNGLDYCENEEEEKNQLEQLQSKVYENCEKSEKRKELDKKPLREIESIKNYFKDVDKMFKNNEVVF
ncbi:hypothetical protein CRU92_01595 [Arcobacter sp. FW59]|nr:hypothetical protein CRU92_01595 [Arcobacter sp. FW59]